MTMEKRQESVTVTKSMTEKEKEKETEIEKEIGMRTNALPIFHTRQDEITGVNQTMVNGRQLPAGRSFAFCLY
jgi:hypothetical protein